MVWFGMTLEEYLHDTKPKKLSHAAFGEKVGVTQATINRYVRGDRFPSPDMIRKIQDVTGGAVTVNDWYAKSAVAAQ
jgi:transcriptional regulator with XRE-family HTH domain